MKKHCETEEQLTQYLLGDLDAAQAEAIKKHLEECEGCQAALRELEPTLDLLLGATAADALAPAELEPERRRRIRKAHKPRKEPLISLRFIEVVAAIFIVAVLGGLMMPALNKATRRAEMVASLQEERGELSQIRDYAESARGVRYARSERAAAVAQPQPTTLEVYNDLSAEPSDRIELAMKKPQARQGDRFEGRWGVESKEVVAGLVDHEPRAQKGEWQFAEVDADSDGVFGNEQLFGTKPTDLSKSMGKPSQQLDEFVMDDKSEVIELAFADEVRRESVDRGMPERSAKLQKRVRRKSRIAGAVGGAGGEARAKAEAESVQRHAGHWYGGDKQAGLGMPGQQVASGPATKVATEIPEVGGVAEMEEEVEMAQLDIKEDVQGPLVMKGLFSGRSVSRKDAEKMVASDEDDVEVIIEDEHEHEHEHEDEDEGVPSVFKAYGVNPYVDAAKQAFSTFSIDVDTASYTLTRRYMRSGFLPPAEAVRTEEFVNFFDYNYRPPEKDLFAIHAEVAPTPFGDGELLRIGVKGRRIGRDQMRPAILTFVVDTSGSMDTPDRLGLVKKSLRMLVEKLGPNDRVGILQYDSKARITLEHTPASEREQILAAIDGLQASSSTHLEHGLKLGYEMAAKVFQAGAVNRVLLLSDGVANLGSADAEDILKSVESYRKQGIFCSVFGFGMGTYDDTMLETLANKGDGTYQFIDSQAEAKRVFVDELAATLNVIAKDVKIQIEFNPQRIRRYRQIGYENRQLKKEDFRNDAVDAGEVGSGQAVTALYELDLHGDDSQPIATVRVRYRNVETGEVEEIERRIAAIDCKPRFEDTDARFKLAACVAEFAEILRGSPFADGSEYGDVAEVLRPAALEVSLDQRVQELLRLLQSASTLPRAAR